MASLAPRAPPGHQVLTCLETQAFPAPLGTEVILERPILPQAPQVSLGRRESRELQGSEAQPGGPGSKAFLASALHLTSQGCQGTWGHQGFSAWKVTQALRGLLDPLPCLEAKATQEVLEPQGSQGPKDGVGNRGPRAGQACSGSQERKGPGVTLDSWAPQDLLGLWATEAPKDPKEIWDSREPLVLWGPLGLLESPRGCWLQLVQWGPRAGGVLPGQRGRWGLRALLENQVSVGCQGSLGPRDGVVCLPSLDSGETQGPWGSRAQLAKKESQAAQGAQGCPVCQDEASASATCW